MLGLMRWGTLKWLTVTLALIGFFAVPMTAEASSTGKFIYAEVTPNWSHGRFAGTVTWSDCNTGCRSYVVLVFDEPSSYVCHAGDWQISGDPNIQKVWSSGTETRNTSIGFVERTAGLIQGVDGQRLCMIGVQTTETSVEQELLAEALFEVEKPPSLSTLYNPDGSGALFAFARGHEVVTWAWEACTPDLSKCSPFGAGPQVDTGESETDTVFRANNGQTVLSPVWHGRLSPLTAPSVNGLLRANELVTTTPAQWRGGWEGSQDKMGLWACVTPSGEGCTAIETIGAANRPSCPQGAAVLDAALTGEYVRIEDHRLSGTPWFGAVPEAGSVGLVEPDYGEHGRNPVPRATGPTTAVAIAGRVAPAVHPPIPRCGPPPLLKASITKRGIARVECRLACHALLLARRAGRTVRAAGTPELRLYVHGRLVGRGSLRLSRKSMAHLGQGLVHMVLSVSSSAVAGGPHITARRVVLL